MTANSVEKHCSVLMIAKLQVKIRPKLTLFYKLSYSPFALDSTTQKTCFARNICVLPTPRNLWTGTESLNLCINC